MQRVERRLLVYKPVHDTVAFHLGSECPEYFVPNYKHPTVIHINAVRVASCNQMVQVVKVSSIGTYIYYNTKHNLI